MSFSVLELDIADNFSPVLLVRASGGAAQTSTIETQSPSTLCHAINLIGANSNIVWGSMQDGDPSVKAKA